MMIHITDDTVCKLRWVKNDVITKLMEWGFSKHQKILWERKLLGDNHIMYKIQTNFTESDTIAFDKNKYFLFTGIVPVIGVSHKYLSYTSNYLVAELGCLIKPVAIDNWDFLPKRYALVLESPPETKIETIFSLWKPTWKCHLQNYCQFVQTSKC